MCAAPGANSSTLPFAVDTPGAFVSSGYEGDYSAITVTATCPTRAPGTPAGDCHTVIYNTLPDAGLGLGWAGVVWQHPANNWGSQPGYLIPPGAQAVTFYAQGATGTENVGFAVGGMGTPSTATPCVDTVTSTLAAVTLSTTWTQYTLPLSSQTYAGGVLNGFSWSAAADKQSATVTNATFYIDDIQWVVSASTPDAGPPDAGPDGG
jgi:hypothetical protein